MMSAHSHPSVHDSCWFLGTTIFICKRTNTFPKFCNIFLESKKETSIQQKFKGCKSMTRLILKLKTIEEHVFMQVIVNNYTLMIYFLCRKYLGFFFSHSIFRDSCKASIKEQLEKHEGNTNFMSNRIIHDNRKHRYNLI